MLLALFAGGISSVLFFGGLWLTVRFGVENRTALWPYLISFLVRISLVALALWFGTGGGQPWLAGLFMLAFLGMRLPVVHVLAPPAVKPHIRESTA